MMRYPCRVWLTTPPCPARRWSSGSTPACVGRDRSPRSRRIEFAALISETGLDRRAVLVECLAWAQRWALAPISQFEVGAAALTDSGAVVLGANLEFLGLPLAQTVHAEQAVIAHAWALSETTLELLATSAAPCGFCRQFMLELPEPRPGLILADQPAASGTVEITDLLPWAFGPTQLGRAAQFLRAGPHGLVLTPAGSSSPAEPNQALIEHALAAANCSSAPYSNALAGVAVGLVHGRSFAGSVAESAAYNPTLAPMQAALIAAHLGGATLAEIEAAVLVELEGAVISQLDAATDVLAAVAPRARLIRVTARAPG